MISEVEWLLPGTPVTQVVPVKGDSAAKIVAPDPRIRGRRRKGISAPGRGIPQPGGGRGRRGSASGSPDGGRAQQRTSTLQPVLGSWASGNTSNRRLTLYFLTAAAAESLEWIILVPGVAMRHVLALLAAALLWKCSKPC